MSKLSRSCRYSLGAFITIFMVMNCLTIGQYDSFTWQSAVRHGHRYRWHGWPVPSIRTSQPMQAPAVSHLVNRLSDFEPHTVGPVGIDEIENGLTLFNLLFAVVVCRTIVVVFQLSSRGKRPDRGLTIAICVLFPPFLLLACFLELSQDFELWRWSAAASLYFILTLPLFAFLIHTCSGRGVKPTNLSLSRE